MNISGALDRAKPGQIRKAVTAAILGLLSAAASLQAQTIYHSEDKFSGGTVYNTERRDVDLEGGSFWTSRFVNFQFVAAKPVSNPDFPYALAVHTQTSDWIFIQRGASLVLKLDGSEMVQLTGNGSENAREVSPGANVTEVAYYALTPEKLRRIAAAKLVEFRIIGDRQSITGSWHPDLLTDAAAFSAQGPQLLAISATSPVANPSGSYPPMANQAQPVFGVGFADVPAQLAALMKLTPPQGALVVKVMPGSVASKAGITAGDVILEFGPAVIAKSEILQAAVAKVQPGQRVAVKIWRGTAPSTLDIQF